MILLTEFILSLENYNYLNASSLSKINKIPSYSLNNLNSSEQKNQLGITTSQQLTRKKNYFYKPQQSMLHQALILK